VPEARATRILIVDDHPLVAEGLRAVIGAEPDLEVVAVAGSGEAALQAMRSEAPELVIMDFRLPDRTGPEIAAELRAESPEVAILFLSGDSSDSAMMAAVEAGATGYLAKGTRPETIVAAVRRAAAGEMLIPAAVLGRLISLRRSQAQEAEARARIESGFTPREREILQLMAEGLDNPTNAGRLFIEATTVRWHVRNLIEKLGAHSKLEAVARAAEHGLLRR
jgi:DNA-binding NarL/FixJ family response regulator